MKTQVLFFLIILCCFSCSKDALVEKDDTTTEVNSIYFPPINSNDWEASIPSELGWDLSSEQPLKAYLDEKGTDAFMILKDGKIAVEWYFGDFNMDSNHTWNSAAKTLVASVIGIAQEEGHLSLDNASADYLGEGWSSLTLEQENNITVKHHLTMTTGLDYTVEDDFCTDKECLIYKNDPGSYWYYHNATYAVLDELITGATNQNFKTYFNTNLRDRIGMQGLWVKVGYLNLYYSTARSMARFGLLNLNNSVWGDVTILGDTNYINDMKKTSQDHNKSYGYLWWLNGKESFKLPGTETLYSGKLIPSAPDDLYAGLGANDQKLYIVPSQGLVIVRMGANANDSTLASSTFDEELWQKINAFIK
ncbi:MAG: serine hydrolase [Flavobacteriaceae bacterium]|nr:MAG: serine hydrolase [Flavobacteriaceae bacterium]